MSFSEKINQSYFDGQLSPEQLRTIQEMADMKLPRLDSVVESVFRRCHASKFAAAQLHDRYLYTMKEAFASNSAIYDANQIPPITVKERHEPIDRLIQHFFKDDARAGKKFLDLGCGFPPITSVTAAENLRDWKVTAADPNFYPYIVFRDDGSYACFTAEREMRFLSPARDLMKKFHAGVEFAKQAEKQFSDSAQPLFDKLGDESEVRIGDLVLKRDYLKTFERDNLSVQRGGVGDFEISGLSAARLFNVLIYFDPAFRERCLTWVTDCLEEGGIFLCGTNWRMSLHSVFSQYRKKSDRLLHESFFFTIDTLYPFRPWYLFSMDPESFEQDESARIAGVVRSDEKFKKEFDARCIELFSERKLDTDAVHDMSLDEYDRKEEEVSNALYEEGFADRAIEILNASGEKVERSIGKYLRVIK